MTTIIRIRTDPETRDRDAYGDPAEDPTITRDELTGCLIAPRVGGPATSSRETHKHGRDGIIEGLTLYSENPHLDLRADDQIEIDGTVFDIEGEPGVWPGAGIEVGLYRTAG